MDKKNIIIVVVVAVVFAGGGFFGGTKYAQVKRATAATTRFAGRMGANGMFMGRPGMMGGGFTAGQVVSKDDKSVTIKTQDGGSKIIFYSTSTMIGKAAAGTIDDVATGASVVVTGTANSDGSVTAQNIQIRPAGSQGTTPAAQ